MSDDQDIKSAVDVLRAGGNLLYPTDTIWGIGCDATNPKAVEKVYRIKERVREKSLIILVEDLDMLRRFVADVPEIAIELMASVPDPLTIIYPSARNLPKNVLAEDGSIAIRVPRHAFCQQMLREFGRPVTSTSANLTGSPNPFSFSSIADPIREAVDHIVPMKYQHLAQPKPSTIVKITENGELHVIRN